MSALPGPFSGKPYRTPKATGRLPELPVEGTRHDLRVTFVAAHGLSV
jgi:hypothetical protein